jgi:hypothetical protein
MTGSGFWGRNSRLGMGMLAVGMLMSGYAAMTFGQAAAGTAAPDATPDTSLGRHDFFYAGEGLQERMYLVRGGKVAWSLVLPGKGEISDAVLMPNGHILFAHQQAVTEIDETGAVVWNYDAPPNTEIHTAQPYKDNSVIFVQNGNEAKAIVMNKSSDTADREFDLPVAHVDVIHPQFRRARMTPWGTLLVAHMDLGEAVEYDMKGLAVWSVEAPGIWDAEPLQNGHVLISGYANKYVREVNRDGETVWEFTAADAPGLGLTNMQTATRLKNGNTLITQWFNEAGKPMDRAHPPVQAIEVTREKKVVWVLRSWDPPADLGPATTIQILDGLPAIQPASQ